MRTFRIAVLSIMVVLSLSYLIPHYATRQPVIGDQAEKEEKKVAVITQLNRKVTALRVSHNTIIVPSGWTTPWFYTHNPDIVTIDGTGKIQGVYPGRGTVCVQKSQTDLATTCIRVEVSE